MWYHIYGGGGWKKIGFRSAAAAVRFLWEKGSEEEEEEKGGGGGRKQYPLHSASVHSFDYCEFLAVHCDQKRLSLSLDRQHRLCVHVVKSASFSLSSPCSDSPFLHTSCIPKLLPASVHVTIFEFRYPPLSFLHFFNPSSSPVTQFCTNPGGTAMPYPPPFPFRSGILSSCTLDMPAITPRALSPFLPPRSPPDTARHGTHTTLECYSRVRMLQGAPFAFSHVCCCLAPLGGGPPFLFPLLYLWKRL